ncbi:AAA family ATPase [Aeromonas rivipollensis]|uniref:AAA family ATPase n=1 Tax=Aeromonas rivipollensis TaxID=948519 RepID=UPI003D20B37F
MIIGLILRNYKNFKNQHYIPIALDENSSWLIGDNGVGKSTILQAIDAVLNQGDIKKLDINNEARAQGFDTRAPFIVPIFLLKKNKLRSSSNIYKILEVVSNITWQIELDDFNPAHRSLAEKFLSQRSVIEKGYSEKDYFLFPIGMIKHGPSEAPIPYMSFFSSVDDYKNDLRDLEVTATSNKSTAFRVILYMMLDYVRDAYNYIYLPAEIVVDEYSRIESDLLQKLLGENLQQNIKRIIKNKDITEINKHLNNFIAEVSVKLDGKYHFKKPSQRQNSFTQRHMISKIMESYFSDKVLHYKDSINKDTPVHNLSSGEKRKALLDLAAGFLKSNPTKSQFITILAVDEPELSLHATACLKQFEKLRDLGSHGIQTICTTHWYGFLPIVGNGTATYISPQQSHIKALSLINYKEELKILATETKGACIDLLEIKSVHDLVQSIVFSITSENNYKWIICEGKTDKKYISAHLEYENIENLVILSVGGSPTVKKIYSLLTLALEDRKSSVTGRIFFLIDTDQKFSSYSASEPVDSIKIRRLLFSAKQNAILLLKTSDDCVSPPTEIEQALDNTFYHQALTSLYKKGNSRFEFVKNVKTLNSDVSAEYLNLDVTQQRIIDNYFNEVGKKDEFCNEYIGMLHDSEEIRTPAWLSTIVDFLNGDNNV